MASVASPAMADILPEEEKNRTRFFLLTSTVGTKAVRSFFDRRLPPHTLAGHLQRHQPTLDGLLTKKVLHQTQMDLLYPNNAVDVVSSNYDISIMVCVVRTTTGQRLFPWDKLPYKGDMSENADVARIKYYRNEMAHSTVSTMSSNEYNAKCGEVKDAINRLSNNTLANECKDILALELMTKDALAYQDGVPRNIRAQQIKRIETWKNDELRYTDTRASRLIIDECLKKKFISITGSSGSGKSAIAFHAAVKLESMGYTLIPVDVVRDISDYLNPSERQVFVIDDPVGCNGVDSYKLSNVISYDKTIKHLIDQSDIKVIATFRKQVINDLRLKSTFFGENVIDLHDEKYALTEKERVEMFDKYTEHISKKLPPKVKRKIIHAQYSNFPLLCKLFGSNESFQKNAEAFFKDEMLSTLVKEIEVIKLNQPLQYCALVLCMLYEDKFDIELLNPLSASKDEADRINGLMEACRVPKDKTKSDIKLTIELLGNVYLIREGDVFRFIHDSVYDAVAVHFGKEYPTELLKYCSSVFIRERIILDQTQSDNKMCVVIHSKHFRNLAERLALEIERGHFLDVFLSAFIQNETFQQCLIGYLDNKSNDYLSHSFLEVEPNLKVYGVLLDKEGKEAVSSKTFYLLKLLQTNAARAMHWVLAHGLPSLVRFLHSRLHNLHLNIEPSKTADRLSLIPMACLGGNEKIVSMLLKDDNIGTVHDRCHTYIEDMSTLHMAVMSGNPVMVQMIIDKGVKVDIVNDAKETPLYYGACLGLANICDILINHMCSNSVCELQHSSRNAKYSNHCAVVQHGAHINQSNTVGQTPLFVASYNGHCDVVKLLLQHRVDVNQNGNVGRTPLYAASYNNHCAVVKLLLQHGADINQSNKNGETPLYVASYHDHCDVVKLLLQDGADINQPNKYGQTPLFTASYNNCCAVVELLLQHGADINQSNTYGQTPLFTASHCNHCDVVKVLLEHDANINQSDDNSYTPLFIASNNNCCAIVELLLQRGANINQSDEKSNTPLYLASDNNHCAVVELLLQHSAHINQSNTDGQTPLYAASYNNHCAVVKLLLQHGADINQTNTDGRTPLFSASCHGHCDVVKLLLQHGADINQSNTDGRTPLFAASYHGHCAVVELLLQHGACFNQSNTDGQTPLFSASGNGHCDVVELLLQHGADINQSNTDGQTPLLDASYHGNCDVVELLLQRGADINQSETDGQTPLFVASYNNHCDVVELLLQHGEDINQSNTDGQTPLFVASYQGHFDVVKLLLQQGADINQSNTDGQTPLLAASYNNHCAVVEVLLQQGAKSE